MKKQYISKPGLKKIKGELEDLKKNKLVEIKAQYRQALSYGDTSENSELDQVKQDKRILERKIRHLENIVKYAVIIDTNKSAKDGNARIGSKIKFKNLQDNVVGEYSIVGVAEADPLKGMISNESPIGKAFLGQKKGDIVIANAPAGKMKFELLEVK